MIEIEPGEVLPTDRIIARGTGAYHARRRETAKPALSGSRHE
jgi:hypothetical protein